MTVARPLDRRAFQVDVRRVRFNALGGGLQGFTLCSGAQVQFKLDFCCIAHARTDSSTCHFYRSGLRRLRCRLLCPQLTSALRSGRLAVAPVPKWDAVQTSRGKIDRLPRTPAGFTTPSLDDYGLRNHELARPVR